MKNLALIIVTVAILTSCGQKNRSESTDSNSETMVEVIDTKEKVDIPADIIIYFKDFKRDSVKIEVEQYTQEIGFKPSECIPLKFIPLFENKIPQTQSESTGAKPLGKLRINENNYFLVVVQQDDYGPIYYGITYNSKEKRIEQSEIIAQAWGDAGDSQQIYSVITTMSEKVIIKKYIETCHADLEVEGDEMVASDVECFDSTAIVELKIRN
jgi:hypothetical protein